METILEAIARIRSAGYDLEMSATPEAWLQCGVCNEVVDPATAVVDETVRFEGESNPDDEAIVVAISTAHGHQGYIVAAYGADMEAGDVALLQALTAR